MKDIEAINILSGKVKCSMENFARAIAIASNRLIACRWRDYVENDPEIMNHMCEVLLDVKFEDGSRGTYSGHGNYSHER